VLRGRGAAGDLAHVSTVGTRRSRSAPSSLRAKTARARTWGGFWESAPPRPVCRAWCARPRVPREARCDSAAGGGGGVCVHPAPGPARAELLRSTRLLGALKAGRQAPCATTPPPSSSPFARVCLRTPVLFGSPWIPTAPVLPVWGTRGGRFWLFKFFFLSLPDFRKAS
jgi:hypothetical protein